MTGAEKVNIPIPQGDYVPAKRFGHLVYTAGMTPRRDGKLIHVGQVQADDDPAAHRDAVRLATANALLAARWLAGAGEEIVEILSLTVYVAAAQGFAAHSAVANYATEYLKEELGAGGAASRAAVGVATLPENAPVEVQLIAVADRR